MSVLGHLEPNKVFYYFEEICKIPHGSGNTKGISDYLANFAKERNLKYTQDELGNVIISKEATAGKEASEGIVIQGHMDMVAVHKPELDIDMTKEPLKLMVAGDDIYAEGTSLGGDDGIAIAYALAILDSDDLIHPHLDVIITVDEEIGLLGAEAIDVSDVKGTRLLNLDSEEEGCFWVGCAGGARVDHRISLERETKDGTVYTCRIDGLQGGHSGVEIHKERGNAISLIGRLLLALKEEEIGVISIEGGLADNAIPRVAVLTFVADAERESVLAEKVREFEAVLQYEFATKDPGVKVVFEKANDAKSEVAVLTKASEECVRNFLLAMPNGVQAMSADMEGLVQTSLNSGIICTKEKELILSQSVRSSIQSERDALIEKTVALTALAGGTSTVSGKYPGWAYNPKSTLRDLCVKVYKDMTGKEPMVQAIHAGLECGLFIEKRPDFDAISMGPKMKDIHTTEEKLSISSVISVWNFLCKLLEEA